MTKTELRAAAKRAFEKGKCWWHKEVTEYETFHAVNQRFNNNCEEETVSQSVWFLLLVAEAV